MMRTERNAFSEAKYKNPLAKALRELTADPKTANDLKEYLGISTQALNQFKAGTSYPKTENLIRIAEYFGVSIDYLLGFTELSTRDGNVQSVHEYTGLSVDAISKLHGSSADDIDAIDAFLCDDSFSEIIDCIQRLTSLIDYDVTLDEDVAFSDGASGAGYRTKDGFIEIRPADYRLVLLHHISQSAEAIAERIYEQKVDALRKEGE